MSETENGHFDRGGFVTILVRYLQTFLFEGHLSYYGTVRGPFISCNVNFSGYVMFFKSTNLL